MRFLDFNFSIISSTILFLVIVLGLILIVFKWMVPWFKNTKLLSHIKYDKYFVINKIQNIDLNHKLVDITWHNQSFLIHISPQLGQVIATHQIQPHESKNNISQEKAINDKA